MPSYSNIPPEYFHNVVKISIDKAMSIKKSHLIMMWCQVVLKLYGYLDMQKL